MLQRHLTLRAAELCAALEHASREAAAAVRALKQASREAAAAARAARVEAGTASAPAAEACAAAGTSRGEGRARKAAYVDRVAEREACLRALRPRWSREYGDSWPRPEPMWGGDPTSLVHEPWGGGEAEATTAKPGGWQDDMPHRRDALARRTTRARPAAPSRACVAAAAERRKKVLQRPLRQARPTRPPGGGRK